MRKILCACFIIGFCGYLAGYAMSEAFWVEKRRSNSFCARKETRKIGEHDWHRPMEDNRYCDVQTASLPPMYQWTCSKCGEVIYRDCLEGKPPVDGCPVKGDGNE